MRATDPSFRAIAVTVIAFALAMAYPLPWVGPVWSPVAVSAALILVGLAAARHLRSGGEVVLASRHWTAGLAGGLLVILSHTLDSGRLVEGGAPGPYQWPVFVAGVLIALAAAADVLLRANPPAARA